MAEYKKLGLDRVSTNIAQATRGLVKGVVTGDITRGEVVTLEMPGPAPTPETQTAEVKSRRTGAIPISISVSPHVEWIWSIDGTTLTATGDASTTGSISFWVF